jgi:hypothetical protein
MIERSRVTAWLRRRWLIVLVAAWALVLVLFAFGAFSGDATIPAQRDVVAARQAVDRATVELVRAAGPDAAVRVSSYRFLGECDISLARSGARYRRTVELYPRSGHDADLLAAVTRRLPPRYDAEVWHRSFTAYAEGFVDLTGTAKGGVLRVKLDTGCRPATRPVTGMETRPTAAERQRVADVLDLLQAKDDEPRWRTESIRCGGRDSAGVRQVALTVAHPPARPLADAADLAPPDATVLVRGRTLLAYREGGLSVVAETSDGRLRVTTTSGDC